MVVITGQAYPKAGVHTIKGLRLKNISHLVRKQIQGMHETKYPREEHKRKYLRIEEELTKQDKDDSKIKYVRSDLMEKKKSVEE